MYYLHTECNIFKRALSTYEIKRLVISFIYTAEYLRAFSEGLLRLNQSNRT